MKVSQITTFFNESNVNEWLKENHHLEIVEINFCINGESYARETRYLVHYKLNAKVG
jgi:hypothetical protein